MTVYSYCVRYDTGAAPNPFGGVCTLVICKPKIRRVAKPGDWIIGFGSAHSPIGDVSGKIVYAMKVTQRMTMREYDDFCRRRLPFKIPDWRSRKPERMVGDCIYDFRVEGAPRIRRSVHSEKDRATDLGGRYALLSNHFYYFGDRPFALPIRFAPIAHRTQGHKSKANQQFAEAFVNWIERRGHLRNHLLGRPQRMPHSIRGVSPGCRWRTRT